MNLLKSFFGKKSYQPTNSYNAFDDIFSGVSEKVSEQESYTGALPWVSIAVDSIIGDCAQQPWLITDQSGQEVDMSRVDKRLQSAFLSEAIPLSWARKMTTLVGNLKLYGNAYLYKCQNNAYDALNGTFELLPIPSKNVLIQKLLNGKGIDYYQVTIGGTAYTIPPNEMIHIRQSNLFDPFIGVGDISKIRLLAEGDKAISEYMASYFTSIKNTPAAFIFDKSLHNEEDMRRLQQKMKDKFGNIALMGGGEFEYVNSSLLGADLKFIETQKMNQQTTLSIFGVPPIAVGIPEGSNKSSSGTQLTFYYKSTINPLLTSIANEITAQLIAPIDNKLKFQFKLHATGDVQNVVKLLESGIITPNRASELVGEPFDLTDQSRNAFLIPSNLVPLSIAEESQSQNDEPKKKIEFNEFAYEKELHQKNSTNDKYFQADYIVASLKSRQEVIRKHTKSIENYISGAESRVKEKLSQISTKSKKEVGLDISIGQLYDIQKERDELAKEAIPLHTSGVQRAIADISGISGKYVNLSLSNPFVKSAIARLGRKITGSVPETTLSEIQKIITKGVNENWGIVEYQDSIQDIFDNFKGYRARMIARTESRLAWDAGAEVAYKELGVKKVDVVGCTLLEPDSDCGKKDIPVDSIQLLVFHPNHKGCLAPQVPI